MTDPDPAITAHDLGCRCYPHYSQEAIDAAVQRTAALAYGDERKARADERRRIRQLAIDRRACCIEPRWGVHQRFADLLGDDDA